MGGRTLGDAHQAGINFSDPPQTLVMSLDAEVKQCPKAVSDESELDLLNSEFISASNKMRVRA
jgi:hypothetical protein